MGLLYKGVKLGSKPEKPHAGTVLMFRTIVEMDSNHKTGGLLWFVLRDWTFVFVVEYEYLGPRWLGSPVPPPQTDTSTYAPILDESWLRLLCLPALLATQQLSGRTCHPTLLLGVARRVGTQSSTSRTSYEISTTSRMQAAHAVPQLVSG